MGNNSNKKKVIEQVWIYGAVVRRTTMKRKKEYLCMKSGQNKDYNSCLNHSRTHTRTKMILHHHVYCLSSRLARIGDVSTYATSVAGTRLGVGAGAAGTSLFSLISRLSFAVPLALSPVFALLLMTTNSVGSSSK